MDQDLVHMVAASKVPMLKPGEYELWRMRMEQYIQMIDYSLWEVIENGNAPPVTKIVEGVETTIAPSTAEEKAQRRLELKARSTLLMGIPNEHQLKFNSIKDAKSLLQAVEKRFGGNAATKKTQRNLLKQQYENFTASSSEVLDQTFDRLQKLISQLEIHGESISQEDVNQNQPNSPQLDNEDLQQINLDDLEEIDLRNRENTRSVPVEATTSNALISCDDLGDYDRMRSSKREGLESVEARLLAYKKNKSVYEEDIKLLKHEIYLKEVAITELRRKLELAQKQKDEIQNFMPLKPDLSFFGLEEFVNESIVSEPTVKKHVIETSEAKASADKPKAVKKNNGAPIIEDWVSDSEEEDMPQAKIQKKTVKPSFVKIEFVNSKEQNDSPSPKRNMVPKAVLMRFGLVSLTIARPVNIAQPKSIVNSARPMTNIFNKAHSTLRRSINNKTTTKNSNFNQGVNTVKDKNVNTARPKAVVNTAKPKAILNAVMGN
ncbi:hypothetical protein Tco_0085547 [Tanacetum coccineum]